VPDQNPAIELRTAAQALDDAANATTYEIRHGSYWQGLPPEEAWQRGITNAVGGHAGDFCALMSPDAAKAFAEWLRDAADGDDQGEHNPYALAVARAILGGPS